MLPADGKLAAAKMEFNTRTSARPYWQLEKEYTLTFMSAMPDRAAQHREERGLLPMPELKH